MTDTQALVERLAGEATECAHGSAHMIYGARWFEARDTKFADLVALDLATAWQEANGFDKHGVGEFIRQRFGVGE